MAEAVRINPDFEFKKRLMGAGAGDLKKCFQCGTCTVTCPLAPDDRPFPRKEVLWSQWGLKDRLMSDPDLWLCHQCNDCAEMCPRGASPGDAMAVLRQSVVEHYSVPGFLARWLAAPAMLLPLLAIPTALMLVAIAATGGFSGLLEHEEVDFDHFFSHYPIIAFFTGFVVLALVGAALGLKRYWDAMSAAGGADPGKGVPIGAALVATVKDILVHKKFNECEATKKRYWSHLLVFYGFVAMFVTTSAAAVIYYTPEGWGPLFQYPFAVWHPIKILGNVGGIACVVGLVLMASDRLSVDPFSPRSGYGDWLFLAVIALAVVTGVVCQGLRIAEAAVPAYATYFVHLLCVFFLLVYLPYSKFAHLLYRTVAMVHARHTGRDAAAVEAASSQTPPEEPSDEPAEEPTAA